MSCEISSRDAILMVRVWLESTAASWDLSPGGQGRLCSNRSQTTCKFPGRPSGENAPGRLAVPLRPTGSARCENGLRIGSIGMGRPVSTNPLRSSGRNGSQAVDGTSYFARGEEGQPVRAVVGKLALPRLFGPAGEASF